MENSSASHTGKSVGVTFSRGSYQEIPANHLPHFALVEEPTLLTMTRAQVVSALAYLGAERWVA